ncbi:hypothetical protein F5I97DRAFT_559314 [Phlebopus sp. FC_14]|nr:hypothetical protein F5I97DRAFT_559314 [Phlebopus sp. FC_14]
MGQQPSSTKTSGPSEGRVFGFNARLFGLWIFFLSCSLGSAAFAPPSSICKISANDLRGCMPALPSALLVATCTPAVSSSARKHTLDQQLTPSALVTLTLRSMNA